MITNQLYIPAVQTYNKIQPAFMSCDGKDGDYLIPSAWGAVSRVIGNCQEHRIGSGQCVGMFRSKDVDTADLPFQCIDQENRKKNVCSASNNGSPSASSTTGSSQSPAPNQSNSTKPMVRSLKDFARSTEPSNYEKSWNKELTPKLDPNNGYYNPFNGQTNPYERMMISRDVFSTPYLVKGLQNTSDPSGVNIGISTYTNLQQRAEASSILPNEPWSQCSSYGIYSSCDSCALLPAKSSNLCVGNCLAGEYAQPASVSLKKGTI